MEQEYKIDFPIFGYEFICVYTDSIQISRDKRNVVLGALEDKLSEDVDGLHSNNKSISSSFVFFTPFTSVGVIAHEIYHAIRTMLDWIGAKEEEEVVAYHLSYSLDEILEFKKKIDINLINNLKKKK